MSTPGEDDPEHIVSLKAARHLIAELRGVDYQTVHLQGIVDPGDVSKIWGYAELIRDATLRVWKCTNNQPK